MYAFIFSVSNTNILYSVVDFWQDMEHVSLSNFLWRLVEISLGYKDAIASNLNILVDCFYIECEWKSSTHLQPWEQMSRILQTLSIFLEPNFAHIWYVYVIFTRILWTTLHFTCILMLLYVWLLTCSHTYCSKDKSRALFHGHGVLVAPSVMWHSLCCHTMTTSSLQDK